MPNVMAALPNIGGALGSTPQSLAPLSLKWTSSEQWRLSGGQEGKLSGLFCAVLCATVVHSEVHTHMNR